MALRSRVLLRAIEVLGGLGFDLRACLSTTTSDSLKAVNATLFQ
jgi:hypothetical protein